MAASGGYYIASASDHIVADPSAIVGSIGVVGGKFVMTDLFDKLGLRTEAFTRGANANLFSSNAPFTDQQRRLVTHWMQQTYDQFVERILTTRRDRIKDIDDVAHGRIFLARQARQLGMVDELGGIDTAIAHVAAKAKLKDGQYEIRVIPAPKTLADLLRGGDPDAQLPTAPRMSAEGMLLFQSLPPRTARLLVQQLQVVQLLQQRPVILVSPFVVDVK
jgi:protease IV